MTLLSRSASALAVLSSLLTLLPGSLVPSLQDDGGSVVVSEQPCPGCQKEPGVSVPASSPFVNGQGQIDHYTLSISIEMTDGTCSQWVGGDPPEVLIGCDVKTNCSATVTRYRNLDVGLSPDACSITLPNGRYFERDCDVSWMETIAGSGSDTTELGGSTNSSPDPLLNCGSGQILLGLHWGALSATVTASCTSCNGK